MSRPGDTPLHSAIRSFKGVIPSLAKILTEHGRRKINARNSEGETPLHLAFQNEKCTPELIEFLLAHGANATAKTPRDGNSALHWLAMGYMDEMECRRVVPMLLQRGNDINARNSDGCTPLHLAVQSNIPDQPVVGVLLEHKSDVRIKNFKGETPLHVAIQNERCTEELIYLLLKHGADVTATTSRDGNTALHLLAIHCMNVKYDHCYEVGYLLLQHGSDPNARNLEGCIPLHYAAQSTVIDHQFRFISQLLEHESDVCVRNLKGDTPLLLYLQNSSSRFYHAGRFLKKYLMDVNVANSKGETPLHVLVRNERMMSAWLIVNLLSRGADVSLEDAMGENVYQAYCRAMKKRQLTANPTLQMILQGKKYANSSLHVACLFHDVDSVRRLLKLGADANAEDTYGYSPLIYAYFATGDSEERLTTMRLLLDFGADINHRIMVDDVQDSVFDFENMELVLRLDKLLGRRWSILHYIFQAVPNDRLLNMLFQHLAKLLTLQEKEIERGIDVEVPIQRDSLDLEDLPDDYGVDGYTNWLSLCSEELKMMSETKVGEKVFFWDLMIANPKAMAIYAKNKELVKAYHAKKDVFPMYRGMLDAKIDKALGRQELIENAAVSLSNALIFGDPSDEFFVRTLSYCSNQDLMNVIDGLDETEPRQSASHAAVINP